MMRSLEIKHLDIQQSQYLKGLKPEQFVAQLGAQIVGQIEAAQTGTDKTQLSHYICSSTLDIVSSGGWFEPNLLCQLVNQKTNISSSFSNAMQCATWGTLLRQHLLNKPDVKQILLSIVDANPLQMRFWEENDAWGKTSQRVTLVHLTLPDVFQEGLQDVLYLNKCNPEVMLYEYATELQNSAQKNINSTVCAPYFEAKMRKGIKRSLKAYSHLPDRYEEYGHVCGSDPWISVAHDKLDNSVGAKDYLLSSIASEGYFCFLRAHVTAHTHVQLEE